MENVPRLLRLQIESEFPLPPDELAWGYQPLARSHSPGNGFPGQQEFLVVALRKESVEDYAEIFAACGVNAAFTLGASARSYLCPQSLGSYAMLDIGRTQSELSCFEKGIPSTIRVLPWGDENVTQALVEAVGLTHDDAEALKLKLAKPAPGDGQPGHKVEAALAAALDGLIACLSGHLQAQNLYLTGRSACYPDLGPQLTKRLPSRIICQPLDPGPGQGRSAAVLGLETATHSGGANSLLLLQAKPASQNAGIAGPIPWKLMRLAALLALSLVALPYLEAFALKPLLSRKLSSLNADRARLPIIDHELAFLQELKQNQPPYLDALFLLAKAAAPGARIDSLSMNRHGDLSLRGSMQNSQQVTDFRSKLIESGFFSNVTVDEQSPGPGPGGMPGLGAMPGPGGQKVVVRMTAQWKSAAARLTIAIGPTVEEVEKARTRVRDPQPAMPPMMPGGPLMMSGGPSVMAGGAPGMPMTSAMDGPGPPRISTLRRIVPGNLPDRPQTPGETGSPMPPGSGPPGAPANSAPAPVPLP